jgi:hypothetical protein
MTEPKTFHQNYVEIIDQGNAVNNGIYGSYLVKSREAPPSESRLP